MAKQLSAFDTLTKRGGFLDCQLGKGWSAPFTGFSWKVFRGYVALVEAWYEADDCNRHYIESALWEVKQTFQESELDAARLAIWACGHEQAMLELWGRIAPPTGLATDE